MLLKENALNAKSVSDYSDQVIIRLINASPYL
jgi:hypothetical protein